MGETLRLVNGIQHTGSAGGIYETTQHFNDIKEHLHVVKRDIEHLVQRNMVLGSIFFRKLFSPVVLHAASEGFPFQNFLSNAAFPKLQFWKGLAKTEQVECLSQSDQPWAA